MALTTGDRQQIFTRLAPAIGGRRPRCCSTSSHPLPDAERVTVARLTETDHRIDGVELRLDAKIDNLANGSRR